MPDTQYKDRSRAADRTLPSHQPARGFRRRSRLILVLGGAASGKSQAALELAGNRGPKVLVATGQALDREMAERIARHRASRSSDWHTAEVPVDLAGWFREHAAAYRTIVVDCLTLWLSNLLGQVRDGAVPEQVGELLDVIRASPARIVLVSNELGLGVVPANRTGRRFRDLAGKAHQQIATSADEVYLAVAGLRLRLK